MIFPLDFTAMFGVHQGLYCWRRCCLRSQSDYLYQKGGIHWQRDITSTKRQQKVSQNARGLLWRHIIWGSIVCWKEVSMAGTSNYIPQILWHYSDVIMGVMASQITSLTIVYSAVYSRADQRKYQSSASLAFVRGIHLWPVNSPRKWPVTRKNISIWWRHHGMYSLVLAHDNIVQCMSYRE